VSIHPLHVLPEAIDNSEMEFTLMATLLACIPSAVFFAMACKAPGIFVRAWVRIDIARRLPWTSVPIETNGNVTNNMYLFRPCRFRLNCQKYVLIPALSFSSEPSFQGRLVTYLPRLLQ